MNKITILGAGAFGFAIAKIIADKHTEKELFLFDVNSDCIDHIHNNRRHPFFHEDTELPDHIHATKDLEHAVSGADLIVLAIPSKFLRGAVKQFLPFLPNKVTFLNVAKGLETETNLRVSEMVSQELQGSGIDYHMCCLSGGMIAREVTLGNPLCADLACEDIAVAKDVSELISSSYLKVNHTDDLVGVELSGAFKNVIAIGAGIFDGMGYAESSKSAFVSEASREITNLALALGADPSTYSSGSHAWFGDLMTTCFGASRNREFGAKIGSGVRISSAVQEMKDNNKFVEGYITTAVVHELLKKNRIRAPLLDSIYSVLYQERPPADFVRRFTAV